MLEGFVPYPEEFVKRYTEKGYWAGRTLGDEFDQFVSQFSDRVAIAYGGQHVSYREMGEKVNRLALHFIEIGLRTYDRMIFEAIEREKITIMPAPPPLLIRRKDQGHHQQGSRKDQRRRGGKPYPGPSQS